MKTSRLNACLAAAVATVMAGTVQAQEVASIDEAPNLKASAGSAGDAGQCFARVNVPAVYRTESVKTEIRPKMARFKITPPAFKDASETVTVSPAMMKIKAVQPELVEKTEKLEVMASTKLWVRDSLKGTQPLTQGEIADIKGSGVDMAKVSAGSCLYEHFAPATIEDLPTKVLVSEATEKLSVIDAVLKDGVATVTTSPAHTRMIEVPPSFKKGEEKVMVTPATKKWQTECGAVQQVDHMTGETLCLVDVSAKYETVPTDMVDVPALITNVDEKAATKTIKIKTLVSDAKENRVAVPAKFDFIDRQRVSKPASYSWIAKNAKPAYGSEPTGRSACLVETPAKMAEYKRQVVKTAGRFDVEKIPAETTTVQTKQLVSKAISKQYMQQPEFKTVKRQIMVSDAKIEWKPVLCQVNFSEDIIVQLQKALTKRGYEPGPIDGIMGRGTTNAIRAYQKANKMADGGLTIETLDKLGIKM